MSRQVAKPTHREVEDGFYWTQECLDLGDMEELDGFDMSAWVDPGNTVHNCQNAFLLDGERSLLFDTLTQPNSEAVVDLLDTLLDGDDLDYLVISHPEANHAGNTFTILEAYPDATLIVPGRGAGHGEGHGAEHELYHIAAESRSEGAVSNDVVHVDGGETIDLGGYTVEFHRPRFADHSFTTWMTERRTDTLFTVDWLGFLHQSCDCLSYASEFEHDVAVEQVFRFHALAFPWLQFSDPERIEAAVDEVAGTFDPATIAPAHGTVVREDPARYFELFGTAAGHLAELGERENMRSKLEYILPSRTGVEG